MTIPRIARIEEPAKCDRNFRGGLYHIWTERTGDQPHAMFKAQLDLLKFENEMLQQGVSEKMIEKHRDLVMDHVQDEQALDSESA